MNAAGSKWSSVWNEKGERRCSKCKQYKQAGEFYRRVKGGGGELMSICKMCHNEWHNNRRREKRAEADKGITQTGPAPLNYCPPWTPPTAADRLGYCPVHGWAWSNGAGPHRCACGRPWAQVIAPARVCECIKA